MLSTVAVPGIIFVILAVCIGFFLVAGVSYKNQQKRHSKLVSAQSAGPLPKDTDVEKRKIAEEYCKIAAEVETCKEESVYKKYFMLAAPYYQLLLGTARRYRQHDLTDAAFLGDLADAADNARLADILTKDGFSIPIRASAFDKTTTFKNCMNLDKAVLESELSKQYSILKQYQQQIDCRQLMDQSGRLLYTILQEIKQQDAAACQTDIARLGQVLEQNGCHAVYADDACVAHSKTMRVAFRDDIATATELPGLYSKDASNHYDLIGTFGGTVRNSR